MPASRSRPPSSRPPPRLRPQAPRVSFPERIATDGSCAVTSGILENMQIAARPSRLSDKSDGRAAAWMEEKLIEVLWHGRGGQGAFTASRLLGAAWCMEEGRHALAFPSFGPERRGAPMCAYTKLANAPIGDRSELARADFVVYLDDTLVGGDWEAELKPNGRALVNTVRHFDDARVVTVDADGISSAILGRAIPNTALLGALCALVDGLTRDDMAQSIQGYMPQKLVARNIDVVDAVLESWGQGVRL